MENHLGRYLKKTEDVHHIDGDKLNNNLSNLMVMDHVEHEKLHNPAIVYYDEFRTCPVCKVTFQWTDTQQRYFRKNGNRSRSRNMYELKEPVCSRRCAGKYGKMIQLKLKNGELPYK
jgi:hypothetical protein